MVWTLCWKHDPAGDTIKWKAQLCTGSHHQVYGYTYWTIFAPVISWTTECFIFILALRLGWSMIFLMAQHTPGIHTVFAAWIRSHD